MCVNPSVRRLDSDRQLSDQCLFLQRDRQRGKPGCPFHKKTNEMNLRNEVLVCKNN